MQLSAFAYGIYTMALARPVAVVSEVDRLRVVTAADVDAKLLVEAENFSRMGPKLMAAVRPENLADRMRSIELGLAAADLAAQPRQWREYDSYAADVWRKARPISALLAKYPQRQLRWSLSRSGRKCQWSYCAFCH